MLKTLIPSGFIALIVIFLIAVSQNQLAIAQIALTFTIGYGAAVSWLLAVKIDLDAKKKKIAVGKVEVLKTRGFNIALLDKTNIGAIFEENYLLFTSSNVSVYDLAWIVEYGLNIEE